MTATQDILRASLNIQAAELALSNLRRRKKKRLISSAAHNILGTSLIHSQAQLIGGIN